MSKTRRQCGGFTLLEALLSMVLLGMAAAGVLLPFASAATVNVEASHRVVGARLAADMMEQIIACDMDDIMNYYESYAESEGFMKDAAGYYLSDSIYDGFSRTVSCQVVQIGGVDLVWAVVTVSYDNKQVSRIGTLIGESKPN